MNVDPFHLGSLFALRGMLRGIDRRGEPVLEPVFPLPPGRSIALLPGSFNPPTAAHVLLAERALGEGFDRVAFVLAVHTAGKEPAGLLPEDRLMALRSICGDRIAVAVSSHGLYTEQAEAAARLAPDGEVAFLVGSDKVIQIFEDRWYADRDAALERLFARAALLVAPRWDQTERLRAVLDDARNRRFAERVEILRLHPAVGDLSSTRVRGLLRSGADPTGLVPPPVASLLAETGAFSAPRVVGTEELDAYDVRARLIDLVWGLRGEEGANVDLVRLVRIACSPTDAGRALRRALSDGTLAEDELLRAFA